MKSKPAKPYRDFPLTAHPNGVWCKKIRGRLHYFGTWADPDAALALYLDQKDDLHAGRSPKNRDGLTLGYALNHFLTSKKLLEQSGELSPQSYADYEKTCDRIDASIGRDRLLTDLDVAHLNQLRADLSKGKRGPLGPTTIKGELSRARMVFLYINEYLAEKPIVYRKPLRSPSRKQLRHVAAEIGPRMFEAVELRSLVEAARPQMKAMILLGINCGFGNNDCATLTVDRIKGGWHQHPRPKTGIARRCPLWPETTTAIEAAIASRKDKKATGLVFVTRRGNPWAPNGEGDCPISQEFRKLARKLGIYRKNVTAFYSLRRTFETIASTIGPQHCTDSIRGHVPAGGDMAAVYRQKTFDGQLQKVADHVRAWYLDELTIE